MRLCIVDNVKKGYVVFLSIVKVFIKKGGKSLMTLMILSPV